MGHREAKILWLKDMLDQLRKSQQELQWADNPDTVRLVAESMIRDLESCKTLCEDIHRRTRVRQLA